MTLALRYAARSDRGLVRANNEDSVYAGARLLALADGMGGHAAGEVASQLVVAALAHLDDDEPGGDLLSKLEGAVRAGNQAIAAHVELEPELDGMGTTLTAILFAAGRIGMAHIGDSRAYMMRDGELAQITKDDTFVQTLVDEGRITAEEAHSHPQRSLIMRALTGHEVEPTLVMREAREGDRYLLCSDGLSDPVSQETIHEALKIADVAECADRLIELALRGGGPDNVTVVVADVVDRDYGGQTQPILAGAVSGEDDDTAPPNTAAGRAAAINRRQNPAKRVVLQQEPPPKPKSRRRIVIIAALVVLVAVTGLLVGRGIIRSNYYVSAHDDTVAIMQGIQGSILGISLQTPYLLGCLNDRNELSQISYGQPTNNLGCQLMRVQDLRPSERRQVSAGLPAGSLDNAIAQLRELSKSSLLPTCPPPAPPTPSPTPSPAPNPSPGPSPSSASATSAVPGAPSSTVTSSSSSSTTASSAPASPSPSTTATSPSAAPSTTSSTPTPATSATTTPAVASTTPTTTTTPSPSVTQLPAAPQQPGTDCRTAA